MPENLDADHIGLGEVVTRTVGVVCLLFSLLILVGKTGLACYRNPGSPIAPLPFIQILVCLISLLSIAIFPVYQIDTGLLQGISGECYNKEHSLFFSFSSVSIFQSQSKVFSQMFPNSIPKVRTLYNLSHANMFCIPWYKLCYLPL